MARERDLLGSAVRLVGVDLERLRPGDLLNLWGDVRALAPQPALFLHPADGPQPDPDRVKDWLVDLQGAIRGLLEQVEAARQVERDRRADRQKVPFTGRVEFHVEGHALHVAFTPARRGSSHMEHFIESAVLRVLDLLGQVDLRRVRQCPHCEKWFMALRTNQAYDTTACSAATRWQKFVAKRKRKSRR